MAACVFLDRDAALTGCLLSLDLAEDMKCSFACGGERAGPLAGKAQAEDLAP
jgi:hypothetical protein